MTEPLASETDVDREIRRVGKLKIELLKNITAIAVNEERINATKFPKYVRPPIESHVSSFRSNLSDPLLGKCKSLRDTADGVMKRVENREAEMKKVTTHVGFHNDASDLEEWIEEKRAAVQNVPTNLTIGVTPMEDLRQIRARIKKLQDIDSEVVASEKVPNTSGI